MGMTSTGLNEFRAAIDRFPAAVTAALRAVAARTAARVQARAEQNLRASKYPNRARAIAITTEEDAANKEFRVGARSANLRRYPDMLVVWVEHGTVKLPAQPFMRPAAQAEVAQYRREMEDAAARAAVETFGS